jgi:hypothetical protein
MLSIAVCLFVSICPFQPVPTTEPTRPHYIVITNMQECLDKEDTSCTAAESGPKTAFRVEEKKWQLRRDPGARRRRAKLRTQGLDLTGVLDFRDAAIAHTPGVVTHVRDGMQAPVYCLDSHPGAV